jgi:dephospho-CoA kinase
MLKIALTAGAGTGKSTVARMFKELGAPVLDADAVNWLSGKGRRRYSQLKTSARIGSWEM